MPLFAGAGLWDTLPPQKPEAVAVAPAEPASAPVEMGPRFLPPIAHGVGLLTAMRLTEAYLYPTPFAESPSRWPAHYKEAFTMRPLFDVHKPAFEWDGDRWTINVLGHGLFGSELYLRARQCRFGVAGSLLFAAAGSTAWEYLWEGNGVRPSAQDLVYTPLAGLVLGEGRYFAWQAAGGVSNATARGVVRAILDPFGELERVAGSPCLAIHRHACGAAGPVRNMGAHGPSCSGARAGSGVAGRLGVGQSRGEARPP